MTPPRDRPPILRFLLLFLALLCAALLLSTLAQEPDAAPSPTPTERIAPAPPDTPEAPAPSTTLPASR